MPCLTLPEHFSQILSVCNKQTNVRDK